MVEKYTDRNRRQKIIFEKFLWKQFLWNPFLVKLQTNSLLL